ISSNGKIEPGTQAAITWAYRQYFVQNLNAWLPDPLPARVEQLHAWLTNGISGHTPLVIYVHCTGGCDRTGETIASYRMRWKGMSWHEVNVLNHARPDPNSNGCSFACNNFNAANWYCLYLSEVEGVKGLGCLSENIPPCCWWDTAPAGSCP